MPILLGGEALTGVSSVWADPPGTPATPAAPAEAAPALHVDAATLDSLAAFLRDYHRALTAGDAAYLGEHTVFPLRIAELVYDMEIKIRRSKPASAASLLRMKQRVLWPAELVPDGPQALARLRRGTVDCADASSPDKPDFSRGEPAIELRGDTATLTYLVIGCDAEAHVAILSFVRSEKTWRLRERAVRRGSR
ncbi:MAG: hypothetical protein U1A78_39525 [Polyangia bacterium]